MIMTGQPIDLDTPPADRQRRFLPAWTFAAAAALAAGLALGYTGRELTDRPTGIAAPTEHPVLIVIAGDVPYYDLSGPVTLTGSASADQLRVPTGTHIVAIGLTIATNTDATCAIYVDNVVRATDHGPTAECAWTVMGGDQP